MKPSDVLSLILIAVVIADIVVMRVEMRRLRAYERETRPKLDPLKIVINCDAEEALAKIKQVGDAALLASTHVEALTKITADSLQPVAELMDRLKAGVGDGP